MANERIFINNFSNISLVDPNKIVNSEGFLESRNVRQENLVFYANLECNVSQRSRLVSGEQGTSIQRIGMSRINFLKPNSENYLTTNWTELLPQNRNPENFTTELLGITNITYRCNTSFSPTVDIILEDIRGRALFESGNESIYSVFVNLPYPTFYLTLKGYYGKAVRYQLILQKFQASFNQSSGNFIINLNFLSYKFNVFNDIQQGFLFALPNMYGKLITTNLETTSLSQTQNSANQINRSSTKLNTNVIYAGYEKIKEVYSIYKQKKLIPEDFPELTVQQLITKLENFEKVVLESLGTLSISQLTDGSHFNKILTDFRKKIVTAKPGSLRNEYLDTKNTFYILDPITNQSYEVYTYNPKITEYRNVFTTFKSELEKYNKKLSLAPTFGNKVDKNNDYKISVNLKINSIVGSPTIQTYDIDTIETAKKRFETQSPTGAQIFQIITELDNIKTKVEISKAEIEQSNDNTLQEIPFFYRFDGPNYFNDILDKIVKILDEKIQAIETNITREIIEILKSPVRGIGFEPSIRNVIAVVTASADAFLMQLDKVHTQAFENRNNTLKKKSCSDDVKQDNDSPVYPWPQFGKQIQSVDGITQYDLKYPGDPNYINETGAYDYSVWPEVEFVEEFVRGYTLRDQPPLNTTPQDNQISVIKRILISGFDTPSNEPYSTQQTQKFFYELWERIGSIARYQGFERNLRYDKILNYIQAAEATNVLTALGAFNVDLISQIKESKFTSQDYEQLLYTISNGGASEFYQKYIRGDISTKYLENELTQSSTISFKELPFITQEFSTERNTTLVENTMIQYLKENNKNLKEFTDTYPFVFPSWNLENLNNGANNSSLDKVLDVGQSLYYSQLFKKIVNFTGDATLENKGDNTLNRPFTYLPTNNSKIPFSELVYGPNRFYQARDERDYHFTEGKIEKIADNNQSVFMTSSMLNTPFFIKSIQEGVKQEKANDEFPYKISAYLFLNSLPLSDVTFQYIDTLSNNKKNYIGPTLRKYGAVHSLPKLWVARMGAIWHRYKTFVETGSDIIPSSVMGNFNVNENYDPLTQQQSKTYNFTTSNGPITITFSNQISSAINGINQTLVGYDLGFYPKVLNDFYYFYNGQNLYSSDLTIETDIQTRINNGEIIIINNSDSQISKGAGYNQINQNEALSITNYSILFKSYFPNLNSSETEFYFSAPSLGSRYTQVASECFGQGVITKPIDESVFNGSIRIYWGGTHFGYFPKINKLSNYDEIPKTSNDLQWRVFVDSIDDPSLNNLRVSYIDHMLATFTKDELDSFEEVYLNFSKSIAQTTDKFNLQQLLRNALQINKTDFFPTIPNNNILLENFQSKQQEFFSFFITSLINNNLLFQKGNPTNFNYKVWAELTNRPEIFIQDAFKPEPYEDTTPNALPTANSPFSVLQSEANYPNEWKALKLYVGFFVWENMVYTDNGSFITDFFVDMNVAFTVNNIIRYKDLIKVYATEKYLEQNKSGFSNVFRTRLSQYLNQQNILRDIIFDGVILKLRNKLPNLNTPRKEGESNSETTGQLTKLEYYNLFKVINDKWIASNNYNSETLFEDILFFDRANRDIGSKVIIDIFQAIKFLKADNARSVYQVITSIIQTNNFVIYSMPSYINFYNVQNVGDKPQQDDEISFANKLFGTFTEVDYQGSKQKIICQYSEKPSEQLKNPNPANGYKDDSWNFGVPNQNPLVRNEDESTNYALSNKVVGMNIDFGLQNQGVFKTIQVSQDLGKATSESLRMEFDTANLTKGVQAYTQSVSLYNIYKSRSYSSTITAFGNAMIQPTMYFNLQNVPLFSGPYLITDVEHVITSSDFTTKFSGTRQKLFTPPISNPLISVIKTRFISKLLSQLQQKRARDKQRANTIQKEKQQIAQSISEILTPSENPQCKPLDFYNTYKIKVSPNKMSKPTNEIQNLVKSISISKGNEKFAYIIYPLFYIESFIGTSFEFYENNLPQIPLGQSLNGSWGGDLNNYFKKEYMCLTNSTGSEAFAIFETVDKCAEFTVDKYKNVFASVLDSVGQQDVFISGFTKTWIERVPNDKVTNSPNIFEDFKSTNPTQFKELTDKVTAAYSSIFTYLNT